MFDPRFVSNCLNSLDMYILEEGELTNCKQNQTWLFSSACPWLQKWIYICSPKILITFSSFAKVFFSSRKRQKRKKWNRSNLSTFVYLLLTLPILYFLGGISCGRKHSYGLRWRLVCAGRPREANKLGKNVHKNFFFKVTPALLLLPSRKKCRTKDGPHKSCNFILSFIHSFLITSYFYFFWEGKNIFLVW